MISSNRSIPKGFSLVELLVVILIISILLTVGASALRGAGGSGVTTAVAAGDALFDEARSIAIGRGTNARLLVDVDDPGDETYYLRRLAIVYQEVDEDGESGSRWRLAGRGYTLPEGVYFSRVYSEEDAPELQEFQLTGNGGLYDGEYIFYEFNSEGICSTGLTGSGYEAPRFVVGAGVRPLGAESPRATGEARRDFGGFVIWRNGSTAVFRDPSQILDQDNPTEF